MLETTTVNSIAGITNVGLCARAMDRAIHRSTHLPGMAAFYGPSGYGKSVAAAFTANRHRAYYVQCQSRWTSKALRVAILKEMGLQPAKTIYEMTDQIAEELVRSQRPLIIDEMDYLVDRKMVNDIRDIYEASQAPILMIGEEQMPNKLMKWERFHGRVLEFVPAQPASKDDVAQLARIYANGITIAEDLQHKIMQVSAGSVRRVCVNLDTIRQHCASQGKNEIDLKEWGDRTLFTGQPPRRRIAA